MTDNFQIICRTDDDNKSFNAFAVVAADNPLKNDMITELNNRAVDANQSHVNFCIASSPVNFDGGESFGKNTIPLVETFNDLELLTPNHPLVPTDEDFIELLIKDAHGAPTELRIHKSNMVVLFMLFMGKPYDDKMTINRDHADFAAKLQTFIYNCVHFDATENDTDVKFTEMLKQEYGKDLQRFLFKRTRYIPNIDLNNEQTNTTIFNKLQIIYRIQILTDHNVTRPFAIVNASREKKEDMISLLNKRVVEMGYNNIRFSLYDGLQTVDFSGNVNEIIPFVETLDDIEKLAPKRLATDAVECTFDDVRGHTCHINVHKSNIPLLHMLFTCTPFDNPEMQHGDMTLRPDVVEAIKSITNVCLPDEAYEFAEMLERKYDERMQQFLLKQAAYINYIASGPFGSAENCYKYYMAAVKDGHVTFPYIDNESTTIPKELDPECPVIPLGHNQYGIYAASEPDAERILEKYKVTKECKED